MKHSVKVPKALEALFEKAELRFAELFSKFQSVPTKGTIDISGERYLLVRASSLANEFFDCIAQMYSDQGTEKASAFARKFLFDFAHAIGKKDAEYYANKLNLSDSVDKLSAGPVHFAYTGWAFVDIFPESHPSPDEDYFLVYDHPYSFESDSWIRAGKKTDIPICIMNAGYSSGWCEASFGIELVATEILCKAKGDDCCRFVMAPPSKVEQYIHRYAESLPEIASKSLHYEVPSFFEIQKTQEALRQANAELKEAELKFRLISTAAHDGIILMDHNGEVAFWNEASSRIFGYTQDEVMGKNLHELLVPHAFQASYAKGLSKFFKTGKGAIIGKTRTVQAVTKDCRTIPIELAVSAVRIHNEWHAIGVVRDVTKRMEVESKLLLDKAVIETAEEGVLITDHNNRIVEINPAFTKITGYQLKDVTGKNPSILGSGRHDKAFYQTMWHQLLTQGRWSGEIWNRRKSGEVYPEWISITSLRNHSEALAQYIGIFSDITERKEVEMVLRHQASTDILTRLSNRRVFEERLKQVMAICDRDGTKAAVLFIDLDYFKKVNDNMGHLAGDGLLIQVAARLQACLRASDTVARFGGDEFSVLLYNVQDRAGIELIVNGMLKCLSKPYMIDSKIADVTASIGIAIYPDDALSVEALLEQSDEAMYAAKEAGRNTYAFNQKNKDPQ